MTKEVTKTLVKVAVMTVNEQGLPVAEPLESIELIGNVSMEKAQKAVNKLHEGKNVTVFGVEPSTETYEMAVEEFIKLASIKKDKEDEEQDSQEGQA
jgi:hypothetical protein